MKYKTLLEFLFCDNNELNNLDLTNNPKLYLLRCADNLLTNIDVSSSPNLETFDCSNNLLSSIDVSSNIALTYLDCGSNTIKNLDLSANINLTSLNCSDNLITNLDISKSPDITSISCNNNLITSLDVSNLSALSYLYCQDNLITKLDVSNNPTLLTLFCENNSLTSLDVRNGSNINMDSYYCYWYYNCQFNATGNSNLFCISVDDTTWANDNWPSQKDVWAVYSNDCLTLGIEDNLQYQPSITSYNNAITIKGKGTATIYNLQGQRVHQSKLTGNNTISLDKGIYLVRVSASGGGRSVTKKVYLQ
ncbi:MAG: leucine-rich repeat domain-containing protein, partial [Bacteroidetes bacterium]|nr:leucine-rich repeat domain-containing protein [Bacteroidota bacterium]